MRRFKIGTRLVATLSFFLQVHICVCIPSAPTQVRHEERDKAPINHPAPLPPIVNTTAFATNNTSNQPLKIETKIYIPHTPTSNLTDRQVLGERRIIGCESKTGTFHHSHCKYRNDKAASIRKWITWCREPIPSGAPEPTFTLPSEARAMASSLATSDTSLWAEYGTCDEDEVCLDSLYSVNHRAGMVLIANCVKKKHFIDANVWRPEWDDDNLGDEDAESSSSRFADPDSNAGASGGSSSGLDVSDDDKGGDDADLKLCKTQKPTDKGAGGGEECVPKQQQSVFRGPRSLFRGRFASAVMSRDESGDTPVRVEELGLRSVSNAANSSAESDDIGNKAPNLGSMTEQERKCTDCMKIKTLKPFAADTEGLEMEVKMVGAGSAAIAGVLWVALLSG